ncbi:hypothetical protein ACFOZ5_02790 [Marinobacter lacisalsi]|uniref:DUF1585 domain-containing protein n=1 Tax=Marinobacter lacisalsi TaxID=475979 RepID=A0ABV8QCD0_9GAMM
MDASSRYFLMKTYSKMVPLTRIPGNATNPASRSRISAPGRLLLTTLAALTMLTPSLLVAGEREQAARMHSRLTGVPPSEQVLQQMATEIAGGDPVAAAYIAMEDPAFYNVTVKNLAAPWTNEAMTPFVPLNDYTATVIGLVRDDADFRTVLYDDVLYVGDIGGLPDYDTDDNNHYEALEATGASLADSLRRVNQSTYTGLPSQATAGVMTSRAAAKAFFIDGTNRAMFRFTLMNHLCNDLEQVADVTLPVDRIRQDVSRSPGGDSRVFLNNCAGCHTGMDPMAQAFAYYDYEYDSDNDPEGNLGQLVYNSVGMTDPETGTRVQGKYLINATNFEHGYITRDDQWDNYWRMGDNRRLGWAGTLPGNGEGAKSLGRELAHSDAFAQCKVRQVFEQVCLREPGNADDRNQVDNIVSSFRNNGYQLKNAYAESAAYCKGE